MKVNQVINSEFSSNTYVISDPGSDWVWLIDIGEFDEVLNYLNNKVLVRGVFITHPHFDHIYGINQLTGNFPDCIVYISAEGRKALYSDKLNLSYYHNESIIFRGSNVQILCETDKIELFEKCFLETLETPGHNQGCLTFKIEEYLFTGDSYIPNVEVVTKLKGGNKEASKKSLQKISDNICENTIICPGHGEMRNNKRR